METRLNIIVRTDEDFVVETHHPYVEAKLAKEKCDEIAKTGGEHTVNTVSTDATDIYYHYGKKLGIDIHIYLDGKEITFPKLFTSYNKAIDYYDFIVNKE